MRKHQKGGKSKMGYKDNSPYRNSPSLNINTPSGKIDMSQTGMHLLGIDENGMSKVMPPYSGTHQFGGSQVTEIPLKKGGKFRPKKLQQGGPGIRPTSADSLALYNNALQVQNYYKSNPNYRLNSTTSYPKDSNLIPSLDRDNEIMQGKLKDRDYPATDRTFATSGDISGDASFRPEEYRKNIDSNRFLQRESFSNILDTRAPMSLFDRRISPQSSSKYTNDNEQDRMDGDAVSLYTYDPIAVKPWNLLTPEERQQRIQKYGAPSASPVAPIPRPQPPPYQAPRAHISSQIQNQGIGNPISGNLHQPNVAAGQSGPYSFTGRIGDGTQATQFFNSPDVWRQATDQYGYSHRNETYNSGTATGYQGTGAHLKWGGKTITTPQYLSTYPETQMPMKRSFRGKQQMASGGRHFDPQLGNYMSNIYAVGGLTPPGYPYAGYNDDNRNNMAGMPFATGGPIPMFPYRAIANNIPMQQGGTWPAGRYTPNAPTFNMLNSDDPRSSTMLHKDSMSYMQNYREMRNDPNNALQSYWWMHDHPQGRTNPQMPRSENALNAYEDAMTPGTMQLYLPKDTNKKRVGGTLWGGSSPDVRNLRPTSGFNSRRITAGVPQVVDQEIKEDWKDTIYDNKDYKKGGSHWIQGAINPAHKGYCTPLSNPHCHGARRRLALLFKRKHGFHKKELGGYQEGGEYNVSLQELNNLRAGGYNFQIIN